MQRRRTVGAPPYSPALLINRYSIGACNRLYYALQAAGRQHRKLSCLDYFFPLDRIRNWNRLYGAKGFIQYQFVVPLDRARKLIEQVLTEIASRGKGSFLSVLKKMGAENPNLLSFPQEGYTLALDFKVEPQLFPLLDRLDRLVEEHGGRLYLSKDARMSREMFRNTYPRWQEFSQVRAEVDPANRFGSLQSRRLGLSP
jgi:FAD/FMN-containing dehydrogenase